MKKFVRVFAVLLCVVIAAFVTAGCADSEAKSAYDLAVENGYTGDVNEWLASLVGHDGKDGESVTDYLTDWYNSAKNDGYEGSFLDFLSDYESVIKSLGVSTNAYAVSKAIMSAVTIYSRYTVRSYSPFGGYTTKIAHSAGSGVILSDDKENGDAYIITNYHVVYESSSVAEDGIAEYIGVCLYGMSAQIDTSDATVLENSTVKAEFLGGSMDNDIAVIKISGSDTYKNSDCFPVTVADSDSVKLGQQAIAIGNPEGDGFSATTGTLSVDSEYITMDGLSGGTTTFRVMRVDTSINSGNSGGGLFDSSGNLIGIVNAKTSSSSIENISYAIPSSVAVGVAENVIRNDGTFDKRTLGVTLEATDSTAVYDEETYLTSIIQTVAVGEVTSGGASDGVLQQGDIIKSVTVKGKTTEVKRLYQVSDALLYADAGTQVTLEITRDGQDQSVTVTV